MPASSSSTWSSVRSSRILENHPDLPLPVLLCAIPTARRMRLRLDERERLLKVTHPRNVRPAVALEWAACQKLWVEEQLGRLLPAEPLVPGATIPIEGSEVELCWISGASRIPELGPGRLSCGGQQRAFGRQIERFLKRLALDALARDTSQIAARAGLRPLSVAVGDARTRWGSCSSNGSIRYSWRLILAPPDARRFVVAHEVAHLAHLNHGPDFRALEKELYGGDVRDAQALLRSVGPRLRRIGVGW
jgi:predicted metal-dependent hydrolase